MSSLRELAILAKIQQTYQAEFYTKDPNNPTDDTVSPVMGVDSMQFLDREYYNLMPKIELGESDAAYELRVQRYLRSPANANVLLQKQSIENQISDDLRQKFRALTGSDQMTSAILGSRRFTSGEKLSIHSSWTQFKQFLFSKYGNKLSVNTVNIAIDSFLVRPQTVSILPPVVANAAAGLPAPRPRNQNGLQQPAQLMAAIRQRNPNIEDIFEVMGDGRYACTICREAGAARFTMGRASRQAHVLTLTHLQNAASVN